MQPFELPDFYVPWPARLNPNLDAARIYSKAWAQEMGILSGTSTEGNSNIWSEHSFDRHDYALFCAYVHPEASVSELNLMTAWNVWAFYVDDYFLQVYKRPKDRDGAKKYLDRVLLFMPVSLSPSPEPTNPMERGLVDLWARTAVTKSESWRCRIIESMRNLLEAFLWELDSMSQQRLANPIEYIEMRRQVGAALWSADLAEHAMLVEIPERIAATRPMQVLKNTFADAVHLRNDIFSYEREVIKEGELTNAVLVFEHFMRIDTQQAVNLVNDLLTSRLQQFEHTALTELAQVFQEYALTLIEQTNVLTYIKGLQDWQSGAHEWHIQTSRYLNPSTKQPEITLNSLPSLNGLGTIAARLTPNALGLNRIKNYLHTPYTTVGPTSLPEFYMPFTTRMNPHIEIARAHSKIWARQMGMLDTLPNHPEIFIWDEHRFDVTELAFFSSLCHPDVSSAELDLLVYWLVWGTYIDDYFLAVYGQPQDMAGAKIFHARLSAFMPVESLPAQALIPLNPIERGLADIWIRLTESLPANDLPIYRKIVEDMVGSWLWELSNQIQHRIPEPIDYIEMRRKTCGADFLIVPPRTKHDKSIPPEIYNTLIIQELNKSAIDYAYLSNDIFSYQREIEFEGEIHNCILVIQNFLGCDKIKAVEIVNNLMTARMKQFEHIVAIELPLLFENFDLNKQAREHILAYVEELQRFLCSTIQWNVKTDRYKESEFRRSIRPFTGHATGLGTTALRILKNARDNNNSVEVQQFSPQIEETLLEAAKTIKTFGVSHLESPFIQNKKEEA